METESFNLTSSDGQLLLGYHWTSSQKSSTKGCILVIHGALEHAFRYHEFAQFFTKQGYDVFGYDQRGHGKSGEANQMFLQFSKENNGWELAVKDIETALQEIKKINPSAPIYLFGHSMGSFLVRQFISQSTFYIAGIILQSTGLGKPLFSKIGKSFCKFLNLFWEPSSLSPFLHLMAFAPLNKNISKPKSRADYLSRDSQVIMDYLKDPFCTNVISIEYAYQLAIGTELANHPSTINRTPKDLPLLFISGSEDPVGEKNGKGVKKVVNNYRKAGVKNVDFILYQGMRHEPHNEIDKQKVLEDMDDWLAIHR